MSANRKTLLCRYHYDPLDRLADCTPSAQARTQRFYLKERLTSEIQGSVQRSIFQQADQLLAQQQRQDGAVETTLLATDLQRSVLHALDATRPHPLAYTPYGHRAPENGLLSLLGFNGERPDPVTGHYLLGNGYRAFNPVLMRFNSPDSLSPFGKGGVNSYAYCLGDPINLTDSTGQFGALIRLAGLFETIATHSENIVRSVVRARPAGFLGYAELLTRAGYVGVTTGTALNAVGYSAGIALQNTGGALLSAGSAMKAAHGTFRTLRRPLQAWARRVFGNEPTSVSLQGVAVESGRGAPPPTAQQIKTPAPQHQSSANQIENSAQKIRKSY
ncbi:RHS repeat-associated core domain-containing protein [Pseudomonas sp. OA65]|uniref:RHS repeat-associated core domain-containing protein n=1 Tax=Pseudomonas sp. OA65 TaxID=2818431 RepID=UPI001FB07CC2|nr:RHS repeat-associated core domain-containing protein [Pseudomonas sp. OA65]